MRNNTVYQPPFSGWRTQDKMFIVILTLLIPVMMVVSTVNLQVIIESSYEPVFIASPWKTWVIALIAPLASLAIEMLPTVFDHEQTKRSYQKSLNVITVFIIILWIALFAMTFDGFSTPSVESFSADNFSTNNATGAQSVETGGKDTRFYSFIQLMTEILISACLLSGWHALWNSHQPEQEEPNPKHQALAEKIRQLKTERVAIVKHLEKETARHTHLMNMRQSFINHWLGALTIAKAHHTAVSHFFGEIK